MALSFCRVLILFSDKSGSINLESRDDSQSMDLRGISNALDSAVIMMMFRRIAVIDPPFMRDDPIMKAGNKQQAMFYHAVD